MCSAVRRRMLLSGTTLSPLRTTTAGTADRLARREGFGSSGAAVGGGGSASAATGASSAAGASAEARARMACSTSARVMRPPRPVPVRVDGSRLFSLIRRRTTGESTIPAARNVPAVLGTSGSDGGSTTSCAGSATGGSTASTGSETASGSTTSCAGSATGGPAGGASPASPTRARTCPTSTRSPSPARISASTPATGDGTSVSTLSVDTSKSVSSRATSSPTCLNHRMTVPSVTVSPNCGIVMSAISSPQNPRGQATPSRAAALHPRSCSLRSRAARATASLSISQACSRIASCPLGLYPCKARPVSDRTVSPNSSLMVG